MTGLTDSIGRAVLAYVEHHGSRASFIIGDDVSRAIGRHDWAEAHRLQRIKLRFERLEQAGYLDHREERAGRGHAVHDAMPAI